MLDMNGDLIEVGDRVLYFWNGDSKYLGTIIGTNLRVNGVEILHIKKSHLDSSMTPRYPHRVIKLTDVIEMLYRLEQYGT